MRKREILITSILLLVFASRATSIDLRSNAPFPTKVPSYFPGDGACVVFHPGEFFTFLWPESWVNSSALSFILVAVNDGQNSEEALLYNTPIYQENDIRTYYLQYPPDAPPLGHGNYAWQIRNENDYVLLSTDFQIGSVNTSGYEVPAPDHVWMYTKEKLDGSYHIAYDKMLHIHVCEPYAVCDTQKLRFCVYDSERGIVLRTNEGGFVTDYATVRVSSPSLTTGENWIRLFLNSNCDNYSDYYLEVWDGKGGKSFLRFQCVPSNPRLAPTSD